MKPSSELIQAIIDAVVEGYTLTDALKKHGVTRSAFYRATEEDFSLREGYLRAQQISADALIDEALQIVDDATIDPHRARNMADMRKWTASKRYPKVYGDRIDVTLTERVDLTKVLADADARVSLLPPRDPPIPAEYQVIESKDESQAKATGSEPDDNPKHDITKVNADDLLK